MMLYDYNLYGDPSMTGLNCPPDKPFKPMGPAHGKNLLLYKYNSTAIDPDGDQLYYLFDWGDFRDSGWLGPYDSGKEVEASHRWLTKGTYSIKVKVKDINGLESEWSDPFSVTMPRNRLLTNPLIMRILEKFPNAFPIIRHILGL